MKKAGIMSFVVSMATILSVNCAYADSMLVKYHTEEGKVVLQGSFDNLKNTNAGLMILPESVERANLTEYDISSEKYLLDTVKIDKYGDFIKSVVMPDNAATGKYKIYLSHGTNIMEDELLYTNIGEVSTIVAQLYKKTGQEYSTYYAANAEKLGIQQSEFNLYQNTICEIMQKRKISDTVEFIKEQNKILALCRIMALKADEAVQQSETYFDIDYEKDFEPLTENIKQSFIEYVTSEDKLTKSSENVFWHSYIMANIKNVENYSELQKKIMEYNHKIQLDLTAYNSLSDYFKSRVFYEMYEKGIEKYEQIVSLFNAAVTNARGQILLPGGTGSTGGSGGGGSSSSGIITSAVSVDSPSSSERILFSDVSGHWAEQAVFSLYNKGVISGFQDNTYRPENKITRAEFIKIMAGILKLPPSQNSSFSDVNANDWFFGSVSSAEAAGLILGTNGKFNPDENITRQDVAVIIYRILEQKGINLNNDIQFIDENKISDYAKTAVSKLGGAKILQGFDGAFNPTNNATRAEIAVLAERIMNVFEG